MNTDTYRRGSLEELKSMDDDTIKKVGRFAVSPPLLAIIDVRRSARAQSSSGESPSKPSRVIMESYQSLGNLIQGLIDRNHRLEEDNERLCRELFDLRHKLNMDYPVSYHSDSTEEDGAQTHSSRLNDGGLKNHE